MSQYRQGTVSVANGSQTVTGTGTEWVANAAVGNLFSVNNDNIWYTISVINSNGSITLSTPFSGTTVTGAAYAIHRDFTANLSMPFPTYGDVNTGSLLGVAMSTLDAAINALSGGSVFGGTISPIFNIQKGVTGTPNKAAGIVVKRGNLADASILFRDDLTNKRWEFNGGNVGQIGTLHTAGNVGLGEEPGVERLRVAGNARIAGNLVVTGSISMPASGVTAGTWSKVTVNSSGIVTAGANLAAGDVSTALGFTPFSAAGGTVSGNLTVTGNLTIQGDTVTLNTSVLSIEDAIITVGSANTGVAPYLGLKAERGGTDAFFVFNESNDRWQARMSADDLATAGSLGVLEASTFYGALSGNASTATKLATARTINGASFDGSANITFGADAVTEGVTNLYFTAARARSAISVGAGLAYNATTGVLSLGSGTIIEISNVNALQTALDAKSAVGHVHTVTEITNLSTTYQALSGRNAANGYAGLNANSRITSELDGLVYNVAKVSSVTDLDNLTAAGEYNIDITGKANGPPALPSGWLFVRVQTHTFSSGGTYVRQYAMDMDTIDMNVYSRQRTTGAWSSWARIAGTVGTAANNLVALNGTGKIDTSLLSLVKSDVGLGNVDNTTDVNKPVSNATQTALNAKSDVYRTVSTQSVAAYTLVIADALKYVRMIYSGAKTLTVPLNATQAIPIGSQIDVGAYNGDITIAPEVGVTLNIVGTLIKSGTGATLIKVGTNEWDVFGTST